MALVDQIQNIVTLLDEDKSFISRVLQDIQYAAKIGVPTPTTNVNTEGTAILAALLTSRKNIQDAARKIRADLEGSIDAL